MSHSPPPSQSDGDNVFSIRIVSLDYYMAPPIPGLDFCYSSFKGRTVEEVPVIRIYGSTVAGQKACLHVHRALPYLYVPCSDISLQSPEEGTAYLHDLSLAVEKVLRFKHSSGLKRQHVHGCSLVRAKKFYGYHSTEELFVKIYLYYPTDVARAAALLLGGSVLNKIIQPYESHIPFLLQFMVDYNLYGMSHLHTSKVKFRHPLPDDFIPRAARYRERIGHMLEKFTSVSASFQTDLSSEDIGNPAIWLSSTIPSGWIWAFPVARNGGLEDKTIRLIKRQSICELEGDSCVDDILNQRAKIYSSLSQTSSDMKMVQSLVPIWEEEFERSGVQDIDKSPYISKPLPESTLRGMVQEFDYENVLSDMCTEAHKTLLLKTSASDKKFEQYIKSFADIGSSIILKEDCRPTTSSVKSLVFPKQENKTGSTPCYGSFYDEHGDTISSEKMHGFLGLSSIGEKMISPEMTESSVPKITDIEALGLLSWLASSQAAGDLSSDDELVHEAVLSPLLPTRNYEKALEKAYLDYESASQQECQDILDSVEGIKFENLEEKCAQTSDHECLIGAPLGNVIPQIDGSPDDQINTSHVGKSSDIGMDSQMDRSPFNQVQKITARRLCNKEERKRRLWGPLPFSIKQVDCGGSKPAYVDSDEICLDNIQNAIDSSSSGIKVDDSNDTRKSEPGPELSGLGTGRQLIRNSVRDLMRSRRCHQIERTEYRSHLAKKVGAKVQNSTVTIPSRKRPISHRSAVDRHAMMHSEVSLVESYFPDSDGLVEERVACSAASSPGACSEGFMPAEYRSLLNGKLSLTSFTDHPLQRDIPLKEYLSLHEGPSDKENFQASVGLQGLEFADPLPSDIVRKSYLCWSSMGRGLDCCSYKQDPSVGSHLLQSDLGGNRSGNDGFKDSLNVGLRSLTSIPDGCINFHEPKCYFSTEKEADAAFEGSREVLPNKLAKTNPALNLINHEINNFVHGEWDIRTTCKSSTIGHMKKAYVESVELTFNRKPPFIDNINMLLEDSPLTTENIAGNMEGACNSFLAISERRALHDLPPFFTSNYEEGKEDYKPFYHREALSCQEAAEGVPVHCQNDGSFLYLLTYAVLPPSSECVHQCLLGQSQDSTSTHFVELSPRIADCSGNTSEGSCCSHGGKSDAVQKLHETSSPHIDPQGILGNDCCGTSPESISTCDLKFLVDRLNEENNVTAEAENNFCHRDAMITEPQSADIDMKERVPTSGWCVISQISGPDEKSKPTPLSQIGFRDPASAGGGQHLTLLSIEIQVESRGDLRPDPQFDVVNVVALAIQEDTDHVPEVYVLFRGNDMKSCGRNVVGVSGCKFVMFSEEICLFKHLVKTILLFDPDILMGWEIQGSSLGFLAERAAHLGINLLRNISRTPAFETTSEVKASVEYEKELIDSLIPGRTVHPVVLKDAIIKDKWGHTHASGIHVGGRIVLNIWRLMRSEVKLNMYTVEAVAEEILRRKIPSIPYKILSNWFTSGSQRARFRCIEYVIERAKLNVQIMNQMDMINRTSELARVFGIDFFSVLSRGSQFRVESMLLRLAHTQNYLAISPGNHQVASQPAMESLPLVMEPESGFYADPVVVLDFQSLYPSMIIAYNLCFCTCLGKVVPSKENVLGVSSFSPDPQLFVDLRKEMLLTPNGVIYVPSKVCKGVLPRLLEEILSTRIMVKKAMKKLLPSQKVLHRILNARQLALKLIANVTYGYTAAGFSGRMPCAELADSIVQCGRRTLEMSISFVNTHKNWGAKVIYGDTDSMFVLLRGRSMEEAFKIGSEIALAVTALNPDPVTLKMEKVYHPCFLLTKKRYVGYSYESPDQKKPTFDAKGIETVRRDTCPAVAKTLEKSLQIFFEHQDISKVKLYLERQWIRILSGKVSLRDFVLAKEVRLGTYSSHASSLPPAAIVATKAMRADPRSEPRYGERIPYVVVHGEPGARLVDMVVDPLEILEISSPYKLNAIYYINKQIIPALQRAFGLLGVDLNQWFSEMPRPVRPTLAKCHYYDSSSVSKHGHDDTKKVMTKKGQRKGRIDNFYPSKHCIVCGELVQASYVCDKCSKKGPLVATVVVGRTLKLESDIQHLSAICRHCGGGDWILERGVKCTSLACPVFYERRKVQKELQATSAVSTEAGFYPICMAEWF